jgi:hypothetical protein
MSHYSRLSKIVVDVPAAEHDREVAFWSAAVVPAPAGSLNDGNAQRWD